MRVSKDEKDLLDSGEYDIVFCPICESGTLLHKSSYEVTCSYCGRKIKYERT